MGGAFRAIPAGIDAVWAKLRSIEKRVDSIATAANIRNSKITGGSGLTVEDPTNGQSITLQVVPGGTSNLLFYPPTAAQVSDWAATITFDPDGAYGGGELVLNSPGSPVSGFTNQPAQSGFINLTSGDGVNSLGSVGLQADAVQIQLLGAGFGNPARIALGVIGTGSNIQEDATSWRLFAGIASLVFPSSVAELRCRDAGNAAYVPIRASAFTVTSTREAKHDVQDLGWSAAEVVAGAKAQRWRYRPEHADPDRVHFGPMAEDLPDELVDHGDPDVPGVNTADLIGVLWAAVGEQQATIAALTARVAALEGQRA